jgi:hypothetical protein
MMPAIRAAGDDEPELREPGAGRRQPGPEEGAPGTGPPATRRLNCGQVVDCPQRERGGSLVSESDELGNEQDFVDDAIDDDEVDADEQMLLDRKELSELGLELDNPEGFADE